MSGPPGLSGGTPPVHQVVTSACRPNQGGNRCSTPADRTRSLLAILPPLPQETTPMTAPRAAPTPTNTALPRHLRKSGSESPCCLPVDAERECGRGGASGQPLPQWAFRILRVRARPLGGAPPGFRLCAAGLCREDSRRLTRRCAMVHLSEYAPARAGSGDPG